MAVWYSILFAVTPVVWILLIRVFPQLFGDILTRHVEHRLNTRLEHTKAELQASYSTLRSSVDFVISGQTELRSKILRHVSSLWNSVAHARKEFGGLLVMHSVLLPEEIAKAIRGDLETALTLEGFKFRDMKHVSEKWDEINLFDAQKSQLFVGDKLWLIFYIIQQFYGRLGVLIQMSSQKGEYIDWREDSLARSSLQSVLSKEVIDGACAQMVGGPERIIGHLEAEFLREARRVMSGSPGFAESLSDLQAALQYETQRLKESPAIR